MPLYILLLLSSVGRFSLRGSELGWAKAFYLNLGNLYTVYPSSVYKASYLHHQITTSLESLSVLGLGMENKAKIKLRVGLNLKDYKVSLLLKCL